MESEQNIMPLIFFIISVAIGVVILIFMNSLSAEMYVSTEPVIQDMRSTGTVTVCDEETFNDDTLNSNPVETWYSYSEDGWDYANVSSV
jgi:hypothetical protein